MIVVTATDGELGLDMVFLLFVVGGPANTWTCEVPRRDARVC